MGMAAVPTVLLASRPRQSRRILLVEDHEDTNKSLTKLLRLRGYEVESASNIESALALAAAAEFDVLVSDIGLPDGTGIDLIRQLRSDRPPLAIALTGFGMEDDLRKTHEAGFYHHLVKPIDVNKLDLLIQEGSSVALK
jgi:CheY-like chemotaxis protein